MAGRPYVWLAAALLIACDGSIGALPDSHPGEDGGTTLDHDGDVSGGEGEGEGGEGEGGEGEGEGGEGEGEGGEGEGEGGEGEGGEGEGEVVLGPCDDPFADPETILSLHVRTSRADWDAFGTDFLEDECVGQYPERPVEFRCGDDQPWITIGARRKRGGINSAKPSLKLDFNEVIAGQRWPSALGELGYRKLTLNNGMNFTSEGYSDVLMEVIPEYLAWRLMREIVPHASRVAHARLYVHYTDDDSVEYRGLFVMIEDIDRTAIRARRDDTTGRLWKQSRTGASGLCVGEWVYDDGANGATDLFDQWMAQDPYAEYPEGWVGEARAAFNLDDVLGIEALREVLLEPTDYMFSHENNYLFFDPEAGTRQYFPWDLDWMFRGWPPVSNYSPEMPLSWECGDFGQRTRCHWEVRALYLQTMCDLIHGTLAADRLVAEYQAVDARINAIVGEEADLWGVDPRDSAAAGFESYGGMLEYMPTLLPDRIEFIRQAIEAEGVTCPP